jgi:DNA primase catalytic subunit
VRVFCDCGSTRTACDVCYGLFINDVALPLLFHVLETWCQFKMVRYTFSGRRGIHALVQDERVMSWTVYQKNQFLNDMMKHFSHPELHRHVFQSIFLPVFKKHFYGLVRGDAKNKKIVEFMVQSLPDKTWQDFGLSTTIGEMITYIEKHMDGILSQQWLHVVTYYCLGPRFDYGFFNNDQTHMIKCPLSIHKETNNVCSIITKDNYREIIPSKSIKIV